MDRLTCDKLKTICDGYFVNLNSKEEATKYRMLAESAPKYEELYRKLAEYERLEEQGLLLRLPCKVGEEVYCIKNTIDGYVICSNRVMSYQTAPKEIGGILARGYTGVNLGIVGKNVFATFEEAEQTLAEMQKGK